MINKRLGLLFVHDSTNRETISAKTSTYLSVSISPPLYHRSFLIFLYENKLFVSLARFYSISWKYCIDQKTLLRSCICQDLIEEGWNSFLFMSHLEIAAINIDKRYLCRLCRCTV